MKSVLVGLKPKKKIAILGFTYNYLDMYDRRQLSLWLI